MANALYYVETDELPRIDVAYTSGGVAVNLSQFTAITLRVRLAGGSLITKAAVVDSEAGGLFHFSWASGDLPAGRHKGEIQFTKVGGDTQTIPSAEPFLIVVRAQA